MPEVKLVNITKRYGRIIANDHINLTIKDREYVSIIGPSGCGKTTLIKIIAGIIKPDEGEVYINGKLVNDTPIEDRGIGYVFQNIALFPHMTVWDNIIYGPKVKGYPLEEAENLARETIEMIKISAKIDSYPDELSGGTQQKTAVARALMSRSSLLLLDEPLGALDLKVRTVLRYEIRRIVKDLGLTALHVTHDQEEAMSISDRVVVMRKGRIVEAGRPLELYIRPKRLFTANFVGEANFLAGEISRVAENGSIIDLGNNMKLASTDKSRRAGERVVIAFRPEFAAIRKEKGRNTLPGKIINTIYSGNLLRLTIELPGGDEITVKKTIRSGEAFPRLGERVMVNIPPENVLVYPYPEGGLHRELSLD